MATHIEPLATAHVTGTFTDTAAARAALQSRHADTLGGNLAALDDLRPRRLLLSLSRQTAASRIGQHLGVHLANIVGRLEGVIDTVDVSIDGEANVSLLPNVDPRHPAGAASLRKAMLAAAAMAAPHRVDGVDRRVSPGGGDEDDGVVHIRVGPSRSTDDSAAARRGPPVDVYAAATDWTATVGRDPGPDCDGDGTLPFGAHAAAALAAGEVFRLVRVRREGGDHPARVTLSTWSLGLEQPTAETAGAHGSADGAHGPAEPALHRVLPAGIPPFALVGVGAVGTACLATLWSTGLACDAGQLIDGDAVSATNLNRYVVCSRADVARPKASAVAAHLTRHGPAAFLLHGHDQWWADYARAHPEPLPLALSAVDTNAVRHQLQDAMPAVILGASTHDLRAQVDRYALSDHRCLKCHNPVEPVESDGAMRDRLVTLSDAELHAEADDRGVARDTLRTFVAALRAGGTGCGLVAGDALDKLRRAPGDGAFAVAFVSALAGTLLAAQVLREAYSAAVGESLPLAGPRAKALVQFWRPSAPSNGRRPTARQVDCWCARDEVQSAFATLWPVSAS